MKLEPNRSKLNSWLERLSLEVKLYALVLLIVVPVLVCLIAFQITVQSLTIDFLPWFLWFIVALLLFGGWGIQKFVLLPLQVITNAARLSSSHQDVIEQLSASLQTRTRELELSQINLKASRAQLEISLELAVSAAHELRTPLTSIQGNLGLLRRYPEMSELDRFETVADAYHETARLGRLVANLLALARGDSGEGLHFEPLQLQEVLTDTLRQAKHLAKDHRLEFSSFQACNVKGDHDRLTQLLLILLENAIKYTPKQGLVHCSLERVGDWAEIRIKDAGMGIDPKDIPFVFERFYRADKGRTRGIDPGGTGLGLPIARWIVVQHGGEIALESQVGLGTTAILRLPIAS